MNSLSSFIHELHKLVAKTHISNGKWNFWLAYYSNYGAVDLFVILESK